MQTQVDPHWQLLIKGEELLDRAHAVAQQIEKRIRKVCRAHPPEPKAGPHKRSNKQ